MSPYDDDVVVPDDCDEDVYSDYEADHEQRIAICVQKIAVCFEDVSRELDSHTVWELFSNLAKLIKPHRKKGRHDPDFDNALLSAHRAAPRGKKIAAVHAVAAKHGRTTDLSKRSAVRRLRRLIRENDRVVAMMLEFWAQREISSLKPPK